MTAMCPSLGFSSGAFFGRALDETCKVMAEAGYAHLEVMVTKDPASQDPARMASIARTYGLTIAAIHAPSLLLTRKIWGTDPVAKIYRSIEVAEEAEIPLVVMHPPFRWQRGYRRWLDERLPGLEQRTGVTLAIENMFPVRMGERGMHFHANQDLEELEGLEHLVLDTSHAAVAGHDPSRGAAPVRATGSARAPVGQRGQGVGFPPPAGRRRPRSRPVHARARRERLCGIDLAGGRHATRVVGPRAAARNGWWRCGNGAKRGSAGTAP